MKYDIRDRELVNTNTLKRYMVKVYNYMTFGLALTAVVALFTASSPTIFNAIFNSRLYILVTLAPFAFILVLNFGINKISTRGAQLCFWLFAAAMGLSLASIFFVYTGHSIARVFFITAGMFLVMTIYGYTTNSDLSRFGSILFMGLIGVIIASVVNIWLHSSGLDFAISILGVVIFTGLTAYDTQRIKLMFNDMDNEETLGKKAIFGALSLYLSFLNLFLSLLRIFGDRR